MIAGSVDLKALMAVHSVKNSNGDHWSTDIDVIFLGILHRNISMCEIASEKPSWQRWKKSSCLINLEGFYTVLHVRIEARVVPHWLLHLPITFSKKESASCKRGEMETFLLWIFVFTCNQPLHSLVLWYFLRLLVAGNSFPACEYSWQVWRWLGKADWRRSCSNPFSWPRFCLGFSLNCRGWQHWEISRHDSTSPTMGSTQRNLKLMLLDLLNSFQL